MCWERDVIGASPELFDMLISTTLKDRAAEGRNANSATPPLITKSVDLILAEFMSKHLDRILWWSKKQQSIGEISKYSRAVGMKIEVLYNPYNLAKSHPSTRSHDVPPWEGSQCSIEWPHQIKVIQVFLCHSWPAFRRFRLTNVNISPLFLRTTGLLTWKLGYWWFEICLPNQFQWVFFWQIVTWKLTKTISGMKHVGKGLDM